MLLLKREAPTSIKWWEQVTLEEFQKFKILNDELDTNELINSFYNKLLGNVGEYFFTAKYRDEQNLRFVSRDIGNGAGYDIYFRRDSIERLIEVKTTTYYKLTDPADNFYISRNEYNRMLQVFKGNYQAKYFISRVFYNSSIVFEDLDLQYIGNDTLRCQSIPSIEYDINCVKNKIYAKRKNSRI